MFDVIQSDFALHSYVHMNRIQSPQLRTCMFPVGTKRLKNVLLWHNDVTVSQLSVKGADPGNRASLSVNCWVAGPHSAVCSAVGSASDSRVRDPGFKIRSGHIFLFLLPLIQKGPKGQLSVTCESMCTKYWPRGYKTFFMLNLVEHEILMLISIKNIKKFCLF